MPLTRKNGNALRTIKMYLIYTHKPQKIGVFFFQFFFSFIYDEPNSD